MRGHVARCRRDLRMRREIVQAICLALLSSSVAWGNLSSTRAQVAPTDLSCRPATYSDLVQCSADCEPTWLSVGVVANMSWSTSLMGSTALNGRPSLGVGWVEAGLSSCTCDISEQKIVHNVPPPPESSTLVLSGLLSLGMWRCMLQARVLLHCVATEKVSPPTVRGAELRVVAALVGTEGASGGWWQWGLATRKERGYGSRLHVGKSSRAPPSVLAARRRTL